MQDAPSTKQSSPFESQDKSSGNDCSTINDKDGRATKDNSELQLQVTNEQSKELESPSEENTTLKGLACGLLTATAAGIMLCVMKVILHTSNISVFELIY